MSDVHNAAHPRYSMTHDDGSYKFATSTAWRECMIDQGKIGIPLQKAIKDFAAKLESEKKYNLLSFATDSAKLIEAHIPKAQAIYAIYVQRLFAAFAKEQARIAGFADPDDSVRGRIAAYIAAPRTTAPAKAKSKTKPKSKKAAKPKSKKAR